LALSRKKGRPWEDSLLCSKVIGLIINLIEHTLLRGCGSDSYIEKCQKVPPDKKQYTLTGAHFNMLVHISFINRGVDLSVSR
jgi:hypothetical protein